MSSNVHPFERVHAHDEADRPDRAEVESAVRTIIRWAGDDPRRDGLAETPSRVARAFEEFSPVMRRTPRKSCRRLLRRSRVMTR